MQGADMDNGPNNMYEDEDEYGQEGQDVPDNNNALNLKWVLGFNKDIDQGVHFLTDEERTEVFYTSSHTGVIYDYVRKEQQLLQGHCNQITATACSEDRRWVVTADTGEDSMLVVWDARNYTPVRTYQKPHPNGVRAMDLSTDNLYIVTIGADSPQTISLWDWTNEAEHGPICSEVQYNSNPIHENFWIKFNPNNHFELIANSTKRLQIYNWVPGNPKFMNYSPRIEAGDFTGTERYIANMTKSVFIPNCDMAVTGTEAGDIIVWDKSLILEGIGEPNEKRLVKVVTLNIKESPFVGINMLTTIHDQYLVVGNTDGSVHFYDFQFKIVAWFEDLNSNTIKSISFSKRKPRMAIQPQVDLTKFNTKDDKDAANNKIEQVPFECSDFIVADASGWVIELQSQIFQAIEPSKKRGNTLLYGLRSAPSAIAVSPVDTILAIAGGEGYIILWNYMKKGDPNLNHFGLYNKATRDKPKAIEKGEGGKSKIDKNKLYTCIAFTPDGNELIVCQSNNEIKVMDMKTNQFKEYVQQLKVSDNANGIQSNYYIKQIEMCQDGPYFACADIQKCVSLFKKDYIQQGGQPNTDAPQEWQFAGKIRSHTSEIASISFGKSIDENDQVQQRLFSVGKDRRCFEYDVRDARYHSPLPVLREFIIEMEAKPTCCIWYPALDFKEGILLTTNDEYKIKLWNPTTMTARRTCLGPTYGGEITKLKQVDTFNGEKFLCYATEEKVIGLIKLPLDGNPHNTMGLISHPKEITDICTSNDGKWVFTCGGDDLAVNMWGVDVSPINQAISMGGQGIDPFVNLIEGGLEGQTYQDMKDFFYYAMIKAQVEDTTKTRKLNQHVPVEQLPNLMRAMGYYPTEHEIKCMIDEVRQCAMSNEGRTTTHVNLDTFVKLFVNHRPVYGIGKNNIEEAFRILSESKMAEGNSMTRDDLMSCLTTEGEDGGMKITEIEKALTYLVGEQLVTKAIPERITAAEFAETVLGFEEVDEAELMAAEQDYQASQQSQSMYMGSSMQ